MSEKTTANPLWYKDCIIYALHIRSFYDSTGNGIGDIRGLAQKLDYLEDLGVNCISLLPFFDSPLKDDGYDTADFTKVHTDYGTVEDFQVLLDEAHQRGIRVIIDLIANHTSTRHEWFQRARQAPPFTPERDYYVWSDTPERFKDADIIFSDYENSNWEWDNVAKAYYWHRFYSHQADLNYENPLVREEMRKVIDFWYDLGVDGIRLTSIMYIARREGTNCVNLPEVHAYLKELRDYTDRKHPGKILLAETNLWPEDAAQYFGKGDECHVNYHFPLMPRLYMALQAEDRYPVIDIFEQTPPIPENSQWALFLRNHDDLTLAMVTEEERDYLYKVFAQDHGAKINRGIRRRLAPLLGNDRRKIELLNSLLFSLPGTPVVYYGDEIGMGDNIYLGDRNGVRTPMQWNADRNAGFSTANPQKLFLPVIIDPMYRYEGVNVEIQNRNPASLLWWMKNIITMRKRLRAFGNGKIEFLDSNNGKVLAFTRAHQGERILVVCNLSKHSQAVSLDLKEFKGVQPVEIFSQNKFFEVTEEPYQFTLGPYGYYWFLMEQSDDSDEIPKERIIPELESTVEWASFFDNYTTKRSFEKKILPNYLRAMRWFGGKSKKIVSSEIRGFPVIEVKNLKAYLLTIDMRYADGLPDTYFLPVLFISNPERMIHFIKNETKSVLCYLKTPDKEGIIIDALFSEYFRNELFWLIKNDHVVRINEGTLRFEAGKILAELNIEKEEIISEVLKVEQSNTSVIYNNQFFFKVYRKLDTDINPDLELVRFLSERTDFRNAPRYGGGIQYEDLNGNYTILGLLQNKIPNQGEAWTAMLETLGRYYEKVLSKAGKNNGLPELVRKPRLYFDDTPEQLQKLIESITYERVTLLAQRTAEMHIALASDQQDKDFCPERFSENYQRSIYSGHRKLVSEKLTSLASKIPSLPAQAAEEAQQVLDLKEDILHCFQDIYSRRIEATKTRIHGDYHLGQVLFNGRDFYIIDFEGEPMHSISERRLKKTPFKDVAGMIRSLHYAAYGQLLLNQNYRKEDMPVLEQWARQWFHYVSNYFLTAYLDRAQGQSFIPPDEESMQLLLRSYLLEKAIYEVGYEMNSRPDWLRIPLKGVLYVMEGYHKSNV
ncbi:MAG: maltose alpha-D-glucosyltransferase [Saprospiraceae bacterium]